jgi:uncharacterized RDD family membrane protein YckC
MHTDGPVVPAAPPVAASPATVPTPAAPGWQVPPAPTAHSAATYGGLPLSTAGKRFGAYLLEGLLLLVTLGIGWLVWSMIVWSKGQTPAKAVMGMRCVRKETGRAATWGTMCLREFVGKGIIGSITMGITTIVSLFMVLGSTHEAIWDRVAGVVVVDDPTGRTLAA